jgi:hypothetical protein
MRLTSGPDTKWRPSKAASEARSEPARCRALQALQALQKPAYATDGSKRGCSKTHWDGETWRYEKIGKGKEGVVPKGFLVSR